MKAEFVETSDFTDWVTEHLSDDSYAALQQELMDDPVKGAAMPGCGGLRKLRWSDPHRGKGKRGGVRVIYLHVPVAKRFYMLAGYDKGETDDLDAVRKKRPRELAAILRKQAIAAVKSRHVEDEE